MYRAIGFALLVGLGLVTFILAAPPPPQPAAKEKATAPASTEKAAPGTASAEKATAAAKPVASPEAEKWIDSLASRDFRTREQATRAIIAIGTPALPALRKARSAQDAEVRQRVDELVTMLERAAALAPKRVTLKMDKKPVKDVLNEIAKQTGFKIPTTDGSFNAPAAKALQSFEFKNTPFWEALDKVCEKYGLILQHQQGNADPTMRLAFQDSYEPYRSYDGSFKVLATGFSYNRNNNFGEVMKTPYQPGEAANESLQINFNVCVEPRVPIMKVGSVKLTQAEDENKGSMLAEGANYWEAWQMRYYGGGNNRSFVYPASAYLTWPSKTSRTLKVVKGIIPVTLLADQKLVVVTDNLQAAKGKKFKIGPATFNIDSIGTTGNKQQEIKITYNEDSNEMNYDWNRLQAVTQRVELQDANGKKISANVRITNYMGPNSIQFSIVTQASGNNAKAVTLAKLMFQLWVQMEHEVAFEFHDLPLP
jgi:hypothetical protein